MYREIEGIPVVNITKKKYKQALKESRFRGCCGVKGINLKENKLKKIEKRWHTHFE